MPKKPVKIILKFSNNSTPYKNHSSSKGKGKDKPKGGGPNNNPTHKCPSGPKKVKP